MLDIYFLYPLALSCYSSCGCCPVLPTRLSTYVQAAMKWDEEKFGLEYDLDIFNVVAVNDFNMGAMENKGLNIFNTAYVLAKPGAYRSSTHFKDGRCPTFHSFLFLRIPP